jgi:hypothetical protein
MNKDKRFPEVDELTDKFQKEHDAKLLEKGFDWSTPETEEQRMRRKLMKIDRWKMFWLGYTIGVLVSVVAVKLSGM